MKFHELHNQDDFHGIINWLENNGECLLINSERYNADKFKTLQIIITFLDITYSDCVSNSHSCPRNGVQNWWQSKDKPLGYPGWWGLIEFDIIDNRYSIGTRLFKGTRIHLGTGGSSNCIKYSYDVKLFEDDWPGLIRFKTFGILSGSYWSRFRYGPGAYV